MSLNTITPSIIWPKWPYLDLRKLFPKTSYSFILTIILLIITVSGFYPLLKLFPFLLPILYPCLLFCNFSQNNYLRPNHNEALWLVNISYTNCPQVTLIETFGIENCAIPALQPSQIESHPSLRAIPVQGPSQFEGHPSSRAIPVRGPSQFGNPVLYKLLLKWGHLWAVPMVSQWCPQ